MSEQPTWIFGYGSLIWNPGFDVLERRAGWVHGWMRRFYQGSPDHRGTPEHMGRVVTLLPNEHSRVWGMAYRPAPHELTRIMARLDHREQGGYAHARVHVQNHDGSSLEALTYIATPQNPYFLGEEPVEVMARRIAYAKGPSGFNRDYLFALEDALTQAEAHDEHVTTLACAARAMLAQSKKPA